MVAIPEHHKILKSLPIPRGLYASKENKLSIIQLRQDGKTFKQIAAITGLSEQYVYKCFHKVMKVRVDENVAELRKLESNRLDHLQDVVMQVLTSFHPLVQQGRVVMTQLIQDGNLVFDEEGNPVLVAMEDQGPKLAAVAKALQIMERRAKLFGLDAPTKVANTDPTGTKEAIPLVVQMTPEQLMEEATKRGLPVRIFQE